MIPDLSRFSTLLVMLRQGTFKALEYGDPILPGGFLSLLRIRYLATNNGMQYCIKFVSNGMEGSGIYFPAHPQGIQDLRDHLLCYIDRYHQKQSPIGTKTRRIDRHTLLLFGIN